MSGIGGEQLARLYDYELTADIIIMQRRKGRFGMGSVEPADRIISAKQYAAEHFSLGECSEEVFREYCELVDDTYSAAESVGHPYFRGTSFDPSSGWFFFGEWYRDLLQYPSLADARFVHLSVRWWRYSCHHRELVGRSPLMELENYLELISQSHNRTSWHDGVDQLPAWLDGGAQSRGPLEDYDGVFTNRLIKRLQDIRAATGGWVYGFIYGNYFLTDRQLEQLNQIRQLNHPAFDEVKSFLTEASRTRPSFEGL